MLVLSRRQSETLLFPSLDIKVEILKTSTNQVRIGIDAPRDIDVLRGELAGRMKGHRTPKTPAFRESQSAAGLLNELQDLASRRSWQDAQPMIQQLCDRLQSMDQKNKRVLARSKCAECAPQQTLIVDDNENETGLLSSYLRLNGFRVDVAADGKDAMLQLTSGLQPDIVLLDMNMPRFDGRWTIAQIRRSRRLRRSRVYAVSGCDQRTSGVEVGPQGVDNWFMKPLDPAMLVEAMQADCQKV